MSVMTIAGERAELPRAFPLREAASGYVGRDRVRRKVVTVRLLRVAFGWTYEEIGEALGLSTGQAKRLDDRGRQECPEFFEQRAGV